MADIKELTKAATIARINDYERFFKMFKGEHWRLFENPFEIKKNQLGLQSQADFERRIQRAELIYIVLNMAGLIAKVSADFLFLEPLEKNVISVGDEVDIQAESIKDTQKELDEIWDDNNMQVALYESALTNAAKGDSIWKTNWIDNGDDKRPEIIEMDVEQWVPETGRNRRDYIAHNFYFPIQSGKEWFILVERHTVGKIENTLHKIKGGKGKGGVLSLKGSTKIGDALPEAMMQAITGDENLKEVQETKLDFMPVTHIPNIRTQSDTFGISDFNDLGSIFQELNIRVSQAARILDKHADPKLAGPPMLDDNGEIARGEVEYIEVTKDDVMPQYIVWQAALEHSVAQIGLMVDMALMLSETSKAAFGISDGKGKTAESGEALKVKLIRTLAKVARKRLYYNPGVIDIMTKALKMKRILGSSNTTEFKISLAWPSGLPQFIAEATRIENEKFSTGTQSLETTIGNLNPSWTADEIQDEIDKIGEDNNVSLKMTPGNNPADFEDPTDDDIKSVTDSITGGALG